MIMTLVFLLACSEYWVREAANVPVADPPGTDDELGDPPEWADCFEGLTGYYANLANDHPDVQTDVVVSDPTLLDWWDEVVFDRFDPSLVFGSTWYPVDQGLADDPDFFAVRWVGWLRVWSEDEPLQVMLGAGTDAFVSIDGELVASATNVDYEPETFDLELGKGQYPLLVWYAHRDGPGGFQMRFSSGDVTYCAPD